MDSQSFVTHLKDIYQDKLKSIEEIILNNTTKVGDAGFHQLVGQQITYKLLIEDLQTTYEKYVKQILNA